MESHDFTNDFPFDHPVWNEFDLPSSVLTDQSWSDFFSSDQSSYLPAPNRLGWTEDNELFAQSSMHYTDLSLGFVVPKPSSSKSPTNPQPPIHSVQSIPSTAQQLSKNQGGKPAKSNKSKKKPIVYQQSGELLYGQICFYANSDEAPFQPRSRFSDAQLKQKRELSKNGGACMMCRRLKKQCFGGRPCVRCVKAWKSIHSPKFQWMKCVLPSLLSGSPFESDFDKWQGPSQNQSLFLDMLNANVKIELKNGLEWKLHSIATTMSQWLTKELRGISLSFVGLLSSRQLIGLVQEILPPELCVFFKILIFTTSRVKSELSDFILTGGFFQQDLPVLRTMLQLAGFCGQNLLNRLDKYVLTDATKLKEQPPERLVGLFIILGGLVVATRYYVDVLQNISSLQGQSDTVSEDLLELLPHYLILVGDASGLLKLNNPAKCRNLLDESALLWHKPSDWAWKLSAITSNSSWRRQESSLMVDNALETATLAELTSEVPTYELSDPVAFSAVQLNIAGTLKTSKTPPSYWYPSLQRYWICGECGEDNGNIDSTPRCLSCYHECCESCVIAKTAGEYFV